MAEKPGFASAIAAVGGASQGPARPVQLGLLAPTGAAIERAGKRGPGRPKGARNKATVAAVELIGRKHGWPLMRLAELYGQKPEDLVKLLKMPETAESRLQCQEIIKSAAIAALPYMHRKQPIEVQGAGAGNVRLNINITAEAARDAGLTAPTGPLAGLVIDADPIPAEAGEGDDDEQ